MNKPIPDQVAMMQRIRELMKAEGYNAHDALCVTINFVAQIVVELGMEGCEQEAEAEVYSSLKAAIQHKRSVRNEQCP
jgi:hypothetical protein